MFTVLRVSADYETVLVQVDNGKLYRYKWAFAKPDSFEEISEKEADEYGSHKADGLGFGTLPENNLSSLDEIIGWAKDGQKKVYEELAKILPPADEKERQKALAKFILKSPPEILAKKEREKPGFIEKLRKLAEETSSH